MDARAAVEAAGLLTQARRTGLLLDRLPASCRPANVDDAHAIQDATVAELRDTVAGWKVGAPIGDQIVRGVILGSRIFPDAAEISAARVPMLGVEAEIAFRFDRDLRPRERDYTYADVAQAVTAMAAIEIVDSRFRSYRDAPLLDRIADCASNGAFVEGTPQPRWRAFDLAQLAVALTIDGVDIVRRIGGHPAGDPLLPAVALVNDLRRRAGVRAGQIMTTGTYTGLNFARPGQRVRVRFDGFGSAEVRFTAEPSEEGTK
jgi:2-keto-4-pentenoate hydratase